MEKTNKRMAEIDTGSPQEPFYKEKELRIIKNAAKRRRKLLRKEKNHEGRP